MSAPRRSRDWMVTIHNPEEPYIKYYDIPHKYCIFQIEKCPETGRLHLQGYWHLENPKGLAAVKAMFGREAHLEPRRGTHQQAKDYCSKEETRVEGPFCDGQEPQQGKSSARRELITRATDLSKSRVEAVAEDIYMYAISEKAFAVARRFALEKKCESMGFRKLSTVVLWGIPGMGKSRLARELATMGGRRYHAESPPPDPKTRWSFTDYDGEDVLIIEDYEDSLERMQDMLRILDGYKYKQYCMYGHTYPCWTKVIITANYNPKDWGVMCARQYGAFQRRITHVIEFSENAYNEEGYCNVNINELARAVGMLPVAEEVIP